MLDIGYRNTGDGISGRIHHRSQIFHLSSLSLSRHMSNNHSLRYSEIFSSITLTFSILKFVHFPCRHYVPSFYWILLLCCTAGAELFPVQILVHLGSFSSHFEIEILVTLYCRKPFNHFIPIVKIHFCRTEP